MGVVGQLTTEYINPLFHLIHHFYIHIMISRIQRGLSQENGPYAVWPVVNGRGVPN